MKLDRLVSLLLISCLLPTLQPLSAIATDRNLPSVDRIADAADDSLTPKQVQDIAQKITVRVTTTNGNNGGSGVLIAQKGTTYLVMTNRHVVGRDNQFQIQTPDGRKHTAKLTPNTQIDPKYDIALLQFTSTQKYTLPDLNSGGSPLDLKNPRSIYSVGYPYDSNKMRISAGKVTQLSDVPLEDGTQIGYEIDKNSPQVKQGMSGGPIVDGRGVLLGINTISSYPILPSYTYFDGSKPISKLAARYRQANWGVPVYNLLTQLDANILYGYENFPKVQRQVTPTGYMAKLNRETRQQTVRIETEKAGNGSGVIVAKQGSTYYVLTAKHVVFDVEGTKKLYSNIKTITYDQESYQIQPSDIKLAEGLDLAIVKFTTETNYPVAKLGNYSPASVAIVFAGGYPAREKIDSPLWQWQLNPGVINDKEQGKLQTQNNLSFSNGYDLIYTNISYGGMSGGPVFDTQGRVIGIHGKAEVTDGAILGKSLGISIQTFIGLSERLQVPNMLKVSTNLPVKLDAANLATVVTTRDNIAKPQAESNGEQWLQYGNQLYRTGKRSEAVLAFDKAITKGQQYQLLGNYAKALALVGRDNDRALTAISTSIAVVPLKKQVKYYYLWKYQSFIFKELGRYDDALRSINKAINLQQNDSILINEKAQILIKKKQYREAVVAYDSIITNQSDAYAYSNRGIIKLEVGQKQAAISDLDRAIAINPSYALAYCNRGAIKSRIGQQQAAITDYDRAIAINLNYAIAYSNRGIAKSELGQKQQAITDYNRALTIDSNFAEAYYNRALVNAELGQKQAAITDYNRAIAINPNYTDAYSNRGVIKLELGQKQAAIADYERAIAIDPKFADAYYNRAIAKSALGQKQAALVDYSLAITVNPNHGDAYYNRGVLNLALGQKQSAIDDLTKAAELFHQQGQMDFYEQAIGLIQKIKG